MIFSSKTKTNFKLVRSNGETIEKLEYKSNNNKEKMNLLNKLYPEVNLLISSYELINNIIFADSFSRNILITILANEIFDGYEDRKDIEELIIIANDIIGEIFNILKDNNMIEPSMNDVMRIIDNMRINTISKYAKYYYETIILKEKEIISDIIETIENIFKIAKRNNVKIIKEDYVRQIFNINNNNEFYYETSLKK